MKKHTLISWIGANDLKAVENVQSEVSSESLGPLASTLSERVFDSVELI